MLLSGFNQEIYEKGLREEGWEAGIEEGRKEGREAGIAEGREAGIAEGREVGIAEGREAGIAEGRKSGIEEGREKLIKNLLRNNSPEFVAEQCGLELEYVNSIKEKCKVCKSL